MLIFTTSTMLRAGQCGLKGGLRALVAFAAAMVLTMASASAANVAPVDANRVALAATKTATSFELQLSAGVTAEIFTLANPYRVIVDLPQVSFRLPDDAGAKGKGVVRAFRYGQFAEGKARIVMDTTGPVRIASARMTRSDGGMLLKIDLEPMDAAAFGAGTGAARSAAPDAPVVPQQPKSADAKKVIVIDPGHGGIDPGASGEGMAEKDLVLAVAKSLAAELGSRGRYDVRLTRTEDIFVSLDERLKYSAAAGADLFISLHADAIEQKSLANAVSGASVYTLSERASDEQARKMADKENASDMLAGIETTDASDNGQVRNILIDLLKRETANFSADFSSLLVNRLKKATALARTPRRSAAFKVLKQAHCPSVLVELGYISNPKDQEQMMGKEWQTAVAARIGDAVDAFFTKRSTAKR